MISSTNQRRENAEATLAEYLLAQSKRELARRPRSSIAANQLADFVREGFDTRSEQSWETVDRLWRQAMLARKARLNAAQSTLGYDPYNHVGVRP